MAHSSSTCKAAIVSEAGGKFTVVTDHAVEPPRKGEVQIKVLCVCVPSSLFFQPIRLQIIILLTTIIIIC